MNEQILAVRNIFHLRKGIFLLFIVLLLQILNATAGLAEGTAKDGEETPPNTANKAVEHVPQFEAKGHPDATFLQLIASCRMALVSNDVITDPSQISEQGDFFFHTRIGNVPSICVFTSMPTNPRPTCVSLPTFGNSSLTPHRPGYFTIGETGFQVRVGIDSEQSTFYIVSRAPQRPRLAIQLESLRINTYGAAFRAGLEEYFIALLNNSLGVPISGNGAGITPADRAHFIDNRPRIVAGLRACLPMAQALPPGRIPGGLQGRIQDLIRSLEALRPLNDNNKGRLPNG